MYKNILVLVLMPGLIVASSDKNNKPHKDGYGADIGRYVGITAINTLIGAKELPGVEKVLANVGSNTGDTFIKGCAEIAAAPTTKAITDDIGKNIGSEARFC